MTLRERFDKVVNRSFVDGVILGLGVGKIVEQLVAIVVIVTSGRSGSIQAYLIASVVWALVVVVALWLSAHWTAVEDVMDNATHGG